MRYAPLLALSLALTACAGLHLPSPSGTAQPVDAKHLPPLSGQEQALLITADASAGSGDDASAERNYLTAISKSQGHVEAHLALAQLYLRQNQPDKAHEILAKAAQLQPNHPEVDHLLGKIEIERNEPAAALQHFNAGLVSAPNDLDLLNGAGVSEDMQHHHLAAQNYYVRALNTHAGDVSATKTNLAMSYILGNEPKKAIALLKPEVKKSGFTPVMRDNLALAYGLDGRHVEARTLLKGSMTEEERLASVARLRQYIYDETHPPLTPREGPKQNERTPTPPSAYPQ